MNTFLTLLAHFLRNIAVVFQPGGSKSIIAKISSSSSSYWFSIDPENALLTSLPPIQRFVERLIGTVRREYLDRLFHWSANDLQSKLDEFKTYFNESRVHSGINGKTPVQQAQATESKLVDLREYTWKSHCNGLFELPKAA